MPEGLSGRAGVGDMAKRGGVVEGTVARTASPTNAAGKVRVLPKAVAEQIARGEVVERPSSVVKELVETSIDAGARHITVELTDGGVSSIIVIDDGEGMLRDDAVLAFRRHATSKI